MVAKIGVGPEGAWSFKPTTVGGAFRIATRETIDLTENLLGVLGKLLTGKLSVKQLQGFVGIAVRAGEAVQSGPVDTIQLMAVVSFYLWVFNFFSISSFGGGHIF